uniref:Uncharacterized protein n=1 Tax=Oryza sativa subsp. japonica TaxID=39947 RepID=Q6K5Z6_ORYSJ|nr:hypothetical protein [Oryza sativa Japonica Group]BAD19710.1 hypothetical protein [Oryza sativa Japonica Group]
MDNQLVVDDGVVFLLEYELIEIRDGARSLLLASIGTGWGMSRLISDGSSGPARRGDSTPQAILDGSDETNFDKTTPTRKIFSSGNGQPPFHAVVNPEADQPDTPAEPTPSRPPSSGYVG